jgi:putative hydrolase of the HAD superfamily
MLASAAVDVLLLDLDETLYAPSTGVLERTDARIVSWVAARLGVSDPEAQRLRTALWQAHGTTLRGLTVEHGIEPGDYFEHVYGVDLSDLLQPDPELRALLGRLPQRKVVFTNAPRVHARQVLGLLDLADAVDDVIAIEDLGLVPKPAPAAYVTALERIGARPERCCFVDDTAANVLGAARHGMRGVWIAHGRPTPSEPWPHDVIASLCEIETVLAKARIG